MIMINVSMLPFCIWLSTLFMQLRIHAKHGYKSATRGENEIRHSKFECIFFGQIAKIHGWLMPEEAFLSSAFTVKQFGPSLTFTWILGSWIRSIQHKMLHSCHVPIIEGSNMESQAFPCIVVCFVMTTCASFSWKCPNPDNTILFCNDFILYVILHLDCGFMVN